MMDKHTVPLMYKVAVLWGEVIAFEEMVTDVRTRPYFTPDGKEHYSELNEFMHRIQEQEKVGLVHAHNISDNRNTTGWRNASNHERMEWYTKAVPIAQFNDYKKMIEEDWIKRTGFLPGTLTNIALAG